MEKDYSLKTSEDVLLEIMSNHDFIECRDIIKSYARLVASSTLAKACVGQSLEQQARLMNIKIETP